MEGEKYRCQGCGSEIPSSMINFKTRSAKCPWCGLDVVFPKKHSTASPNARYAIEEAYSLFMSDSFDSSLKCAEHALTMVNNSIIATFIIYYYKSYVDNNKNSKLISDFFLSKLEDIEFEIEEEEMFKNMLCKKANKVEHFEAQILKKFSEYDDEKELGEFVERFSPALILNRKTFDWLTPSMIETYKTITNRTSIPKTWYALYTSIIKNPDSPVSNNQFYLKTKTNRIYNDCLLPIGEIFNLINDKTNKDKFYNAFLKVKSIFDSKMNNI